ncbi:hypothetical protein CTI12_AA260810 [Artemisia annua]|uniref:SWIM-type domain-containing protein n=1 Tax=Artemisia annua TaxID=35608 RepID=A0A2U1NIV7_ARTAN|nr:hypothetical protein CTI12_AA260810 [Artemisia annua]
MTRSKSKLGEGCSTLGRVKKNMNMLKFSHLFPTIDHPNHLNHLNGLGKKHWDVIASSYHEFEVRSGAQAYAVNLTNRTCACRLWQLSGVPCIHAVAGYMHLSRDPEDGVHHYYSQEMWARAYQFSIRPVLGTLFWARTNNEAPLPPIIRKMPGRPRKKRIQAADENTTQVSRRGRVIRCSNCQTIGHNKTSCDKEPVPKAPVVRRVAGRRGEPSLQPASRGGRGSRVGRGPSVGRGVGSGRGGVESGGIDSESGVSRGRGGGRRGRGSVGRGRGGVSRGRGGVGRGRGSVSTEDMFMDEEEIRRNMEDEYMQGLLDEQEEMRQQYEKEEQEKLDEAAVQQTLEEERMFARMDLERERQEQEWAAMMDPYSEFRFPYKDPDVNDRDRAHFTFIQETQESVTMGTVMKVGPVSSDVPRIYHKQRGRSERIRNMQGKNFKFDSKGTGSTPDKAFDVSPDASP